MCRLGIEAFSHCRHALHLLGFWRVDHQKTRALLGQCAVGFDEVEILSQGCQGTCGQHIGLHLANHFLGGVMDQVRRREPGFHKAVGECVALRL